MLKAVSFLIAVGMGSAVAQELEGIRLGQAVVTAPSALHAQPSISSTLLRNVPKDTSLRLVSAQQVGGFYRVVGDKGGPAWIAAGNVKVISAVAAPGTAAAQSATQACSPTLEQCPAIGCEPEGSPHALFNQDKRRIPAAGTPVSITFADLASLQSQSDTLVGQGKELTASDRDQLKGLAVASGTVDEGTLVELVGFISTGPLSPHANTGESVNCNLKTPTDNDFHISFTGDAKGTEYSGIVVEMIPQNRPAGWNLLKLKKAQTQRKQILIRGALFYDNAHVVNSDATHDLEGQPRRFALWEIHPITEFLVCKKTTPTCDPSQPSQWTAFADLK